MVPLNLRADIAGAMTRTLADAVAVLQVIAGHDPDDPATDALLDTLPELTVTDQAAAQRAFAQATTRVLDKQAAVAMPWVVNSRRAYLGGIQGYDDNPAYPDVVFVYDLRPSG